MIEFTLWLQSRSTLTPMDTVIMTLEEIERFRQKLDPKAQPVCSMARIDMQEQRSPYPRPLNPGVDGESDIKGIGIY